MADLSALGLTEDDIKPAKKQSSDLDLSALGLTPEDLQLPEQESQAASAPAPIPAIPADTSNPALPDLPSRAISNPQEIEMLNRGDDQPWKPAAEQRGALGEAYGQVLDMAAAFNRGIAGMIDLPVTLFNIGAQAMGSDVRAAGLQDIPAVRAGTTGGFGPEGLVPEGLELATEFFSGGLGVQGAAQATARGLQAATPGAQTARRVVEQIGKVQLQLDTRAALGGGMASSAVNHSEILADSTAAQLLAPILGGVAGAATLPLVTRIGKGVPGQQKKTRAAQVLVAAADDPDEAVRQLAQREIVDVGASAQSGDVGIMTLSRSLARENPVFEGRLNDQFVMSQRAIQNEIDNLFTPNGRPVSPTAAQDFIKRNSNELIRQLDDRATAALESVQNTAQLGRGAINDIALSRQAKVQLEKALRDVGNQRDVLWNLVGRDTPVNTAPLQNEALAIVRESNKASKLPRRTLELILGKKIARTTTGYRVTDQPVSGGFEASEPVGTLMTLRSNLLAELRAESKDAISTVQAPILNRLQGAAIDAIENTPVGAGVDPDAYRTAAAFTRRMHETFDQGIIGRVLTSNTKGGEAVLSEKTLSTLLAGGRESQAAGARELSSIALMQEEAGGIPVARSDFLRSSQEWIASQFQRQVKNPEDAANFMLENQEALKRFPQLRKTLTEAMRAIGIQAGKLNALEAGKAAIEKSAFTKLAGMNGEKAISTVLSQRDPAQFARQLRLLVGRDRDALRGIQRDIANTVLNRSMRTAQAIPQLDEKVASGALRNVTKKLDPVINAFYSSEMKGNLSLIQREIAKLDALMARTPRGVDIPRSMAMDLLGRVTGAHFGTMLARGGGAGTSLIAARAGSRAGTELIFAIPESATRAVLEEAMLNRELMTSLLKRGVRVGQERDTLKAALFSTIRQSVGEQAAADFEKNVEEIDKNQNQNLEVQK